MNISCKIRASSIEVCLLIHCLLINKIVFWKFSSRVLTKCVLEVLINFIFLILLTLQAQVKGVPLAQVIIDILNGKWDHERIMFSLPPLMTLVRYFVYTYVGTNTFMHVLHLGTIFPSSPRPHLFILFFGRRMGPCFCFMYSLSSLLAKRLLDYLGSANLWPALCWPCKSVWQ